MKFRHLAVINIPIVFIMVFFGLDPWYSILLTAAQLVYIPFVLDLIIEDTNMKYVRFIYILSIFASISVFILGMTEPAGFDVILAIIYFAFTCSVGIYGFQRFLKRGFAHFEEFLIDAALLYLPIGGFWFIAFVGDVETGFSPLINWLTSIHFHYSAFLLPIFMGFLGRIKKSKIFIAAGHLIVISPIIVAIGISFSKYIEFLSVIIYIFGIYSLILLAFKTSFSSKVQKSLILLSFSTLGITILFSVLYALGNAIGRYFVSIDFMIMFHGVLNAVFFALIGIIGWTLNPPNSNVRHINFPQSQIKGNWKVDVTVLEDKTDHFNFSGLVDSMGIYEGLDLTILSPTITDFYENTKNYRLFAKVNWKRWFLPFAAIYRIISKQVKQINLPLSDKYVEMSGEILSVKDQIDGRKNVRAWIRKIKDETVFVALYSFHKTGGKTYMNIALPLPFSAMIGILELKQVGKNLQLTSFNSELQHGDSGIYLSIGKSLLKLPLKEQFYVCQREPGLLKARHQMRIFSLPFLSIDYEIHKYDYHH